MANVLYITYDGLLEPLGQSQVWQYLRRLAPQHRVVLLSFEKPADAKDKQRVAAMRTRCESAGVRWIALRYHRRPSTLATSLDIAIGIAASLLSIARHRIQIVHARSYVPSVMAVVVKHLTGVRYIFDMRGFWADERVDGGIWKQNGVLYTVAKRCERIFLRTADIVVCLTNAAVTMLTQTEAGMKVRYEVIPTCTDLEIFSPAPKPPPASGRFTLGYVGSVGVWYMFDMAVAAFVALRSIEPTARFLILNRGGHDEVLASLKEAGVPRDAFEICCAEHRDMPGMIRQMDAGIFFYKPSPSRAGTSPTRLGEFLATGIPVWTNGGIGDMDEIIRNDGDAVGVIANGFSASELQTNARKTLMLARDKATRMRCRQVAERHFSAEYGSERYGRLYQELGEMN